MMEAAKNVRFGADPVHVCIVKRDLQHKFLVGPFTFDEEDIGAAAAAEPALDDEAVVEPVARTRSCRIDVGGNSGLGRERLLLRLGEVVEELTRVPGAIANDRAEETRHHLLQPATRSIHRTREQQAVPFSQPVGQVEWVGDRGRPVRIW